MHRSGLGTSDGVSHRQVFFAQGYIFDTSANGTISSDSTSHSITLHNQILQHSLLLYILMFCAQMLLANCKTIKKSRYVLTRQHIQQEQTGRGV